MGILGTRSIAFGLTDFPQEGQAGGEEAVAVQMDEEEEEEEEDGDEEEGEEEARDAADQGEQE